MHFSSKYNIDDEVFLVHQNRIIKGSILDIKVAVNRKRGLPTSAPPAAKRICLISYNITFKLPGSRKVHTMWLEEEDVVFYVEGLFFHKRWGSSK